MPGLRSVCVPSSLVGLVLCAGVSSAQQALHESGPWDGVDGHQAHGVDGVRAADDFVLADGPAVYPVDEIRVRLITNTTDLSAGELVLYNDASERPGDALLTVNAPAIGQIDEIFGGFRVVDLIFADLGLELTPGRYWVAPALLGDGTGYDSSYFAQSTQTIGAEAVGRAAPDQPWTPINEAGSSRPCRSSSRCSAAIR